MPIITLRVRWPRSPDSNFWLSPIFHDAYDLWVVLVSKGNIHPGRLTWNLQITHIEMKMIFQASMIMFRVNLPECMFVCMLSVFWFFLVEDLFGLVLPIPSTYGMFTHVCHKKLTIHLGKYYQSHGFIVFSILKFKHLNKKTPKKSWRVARCFPCHVLGENCVVEAPKDRALRREEKATIELMCFQHARTLLCWVKMAG